MTKNREGGKSIMRTLLLPELADKTFVALKEAGASSYYQTTFQTVARQFIRYATEKDAQTFSMDLGLQFLEDHYSVHDAHHLL